MAGPTATPVGTGSAGTYYFLDNVIAFAGRLYSGVHGSGLKVTASGPASLVLQVSAGQFSRMQSPGELYSYAGGTVTLSAADATYCRIDTISIWWNGSAAVLVVTPGPAESNSTPIPVGAPPTDDGVSYNIVLATVVVYPGVTAVDDDLIYDRRFFLPFAFTGTNYTLATSVVAGPASASKPAIWTASGDLGAVASTGRPLLTAGVQSVGAIDLAAEVTGDLPLANVAPASAASRLLGRGSASGAGDWQEVTLGSGLAMAAAVLSATGGSSGIRTVRLGSDTSVASSMTGVEVTGMQFGATGTGTFMVVYAMKYRSDTTAQGIRYSLNHTGTATVLYNSMVPGSSAGAHNQASAVTNLAGASARVGATTTPLIHSVSVDTVNTDMLLWLFALIDVTADGDLELWHAGETATGTITTKAGAGALMVQLT